MQTFVINTGGLCLLSIEHTHTHTASCIMCYVCTCWWPLYVSSSVSHSLLLMCQKCQLPSSVDIICCSAFSLSQGNWPVGRLPGSGRVESNNCEWGKQYLSWLPHQIRADRGGIISNWNRREGSSWTDKMGNVIMREAIIKESMRCTCQCTSTRQ